MKKPDFPNKLLEDIGLSPDSPKPADIIGTLYYLIYTSLDERQSEVIVRYYTTEATLANIAEALNISVERVRQLCKHSLRCLRSISNYHMLQKGISAFYENRQAVATDAAYNKGYNVGYREGSSITPKVPIEIENNKSVQDTLYDMDLSVRTFNSLSRAGIKTVLDIINTGSEEISCIRNLGRKSYDELVDKLVSDYGEEKHNWIYPTHVTKK